MNQEVAPVVAAPVRLSKVGRPLKFKNVRTLQRKIVEYFDSCTETDELPTITGLAYALGTTRRTLIDTQDNPEFSHAITMAKAYIESKLESKALAGKTNPAVSIFSLKNNYGWTDRVEIASTNVNVEVELDPATAEAFGRFISDN